MLPQRRQDAISVRQLGHELLVYDTRQNKVHCLNEISALIWQHCDGQTSAAGLIALAQARLGIADASALVHLALAQLERRGLLEAATQAVLESPAVRVSRREALKALVAAAIALPVIATMTPKASASRIVSFGTNCPEGTIVCNTRFNSRICCDSSTEDCNQGICEPKASPQPPGPSNNPPPNIETP